ncbi:MAG: deoxyribose-phosphate aldolase [Vulcanimicrobiaceae bacterium]
MARVPVRIDAAALESRAADLVRRAFKADAKAAAIDLAISCMDLTTLEGRDTVATVRTLCARSRAPAPDAPSVAAVCVFPNFVATAAAELARSPVRVAAVATAFPAGQSSLAVKLRETRDAIDAGAHEIDMVIDRGAFLSGREADVAAEIAAVRVACGETTLKVILEVGELGSYAAIRRACDLALAGGADFVKTATGKIGVSTTPAIALVLSEAIAHHARRTGARVGLKLAGGIRTTKGALGYIAIVHETLGDDWLRPERFRFGASSLLDDLLMQRAKRTSGAYGDPTRAGVAS